MPQKRCGFGFNCGSMMMQPGLDPKECPNWITCGKVQTYSPEERIELQRRVRHGRRQIDERFQTTRTETAIMMLMKRGNPQQASDFGLDTEQQAVAEQLATMQEAIDRLDGGYVAPAGALVHKYSVKRPGAVVTEEDGTEKHYPRIYYYNKLLAPNNMFEPVEEERPVRAIHLSHNKDPRNIEARLGIERRNRMQQIQNRLQIAREALEAATAIADAPMDALVESASGIVLAENINDNARTTLSTDSDSADSATEPSSTGATT